MNTISRRHLIAAGAASFTLAPMTALQARTLDGERPTGPGFGPLSAKLPLNTAELPVELQNIAFITLPDHFEYSVISVAGSTLSDGNTVPGGHDGMAAFKGPRGTTLVVRNHELGTSGTAVVCPSGTYNPAVRGGTTTLVLDRRGRLIEHYGSLAGTVRNCAGGPTPWGTWLTCEETFSTNNDVRHGYVFEVPASGFSDAVPLKELGRFNHEAAAIDPRTSAVYLTEDRGDSLLYRFTPACRGNLRGGGKLEALRLLDWPTGADTRTGFLGNLFLPFACDWVPVDDYDPATDTTRAEGASKGAALFTRGEGAWYGNGLIYFCCSNGGDLGRGQIFAYDPKDSTLMLFVESVDAAVLEAPDNIVVGPDGQLYLCEDGGGTDNIVGVSHAGELFMAVQNNFNSSEFAGACFSHDGRFMIVNSQSPGLTYVIHGPWKSC